MLFSARPIQRRKPNHTAKIASTKRVPLICCVRVTAEMVDVTSCLPCTMCC
ncbi:Uncharacterised protein [Vibrio cholerae]|nr:Uncharacterised protein [Vibrio cholerae]